jgi:ABC-2 type transport system ATP-binding protein
MIEVNSLCKTFTVHKKQPGFIGSVRSLFHREKIEKKAVDQVSFNVEAGEILGLVGANGAGKTTLVKMLTGIIHPTSGSAKVLGYVPWERNNKLRSLMALIMGQKAQLWWDLPAGDCFLLLKEIYRIEDKDFKERLDYLTELLEVKDEINIQIRRLSLGERMKMELVAALLHQPKVVFLDEPTIGLDFTAQRVVRNFLLQYRKDHNPVMILTSHYMEDIKKLCKRIMIIKDGSLVFDGSLSKVQSIASHKVILARLDKAIDDESHLLGKLPENFTHKNKVILLQKDLVKVQIPKGDISEGASILLNNLEVNDLTIEEPAIETIIENIFKSKDLSELSGVNS